MCWHTYVQLPDRAPCGSFHVGSRFIKANKSPFIALITGRLRDRIGNLLAKESS